MNKNEFLSELESGLAGLPREDVEERIAFYGEMIDDRIEEGESEEEAVAGIGAVSDVVSQIVSETPLNKIVKEKMAKRRAPKAWEIVLIVLGFPLWFPLLLAAAVVVFALYAVLWVLIAAFWAVDIALAVCAVAGVLIAVSDFVRGFGPQGAAVLGIGLFAGGLAIFTAFGCIAASKGAVRLTKKVFTKIKRKIAGKGSSK